MRVRVVDFRRHSGGGRRFFIQLTKALQQGGEITGAGSDLTDHSRPAWRVLRRMAVAARLTQLARDPDAIRAAAQAQVPRLRVRTWADVAADYVRVFKMALLRAKAA